MRVLAVGAALTVGCYHPNVATEVPCAADGTCPNGQTCDMTREPPTCVGGPNTPDAAVDAAPPLNLCGDTSGLQPGAVWPLIHGCPTNAGRSAVRGPATGATAVAPTGLEHNRRGVVVGIGNQVIIQETSAGVVSSYDGASGDPGWVYSGTNGAGLEPFPIVGAQNRVYLTTNYGKVFCIDFATGLEVWQHQFSGAFSAPVIAAPGTMYFGAQAPYGFYAVDTETHAQKWHFTVPNTGDARTAPAVGNGRVFFVDTLNSELYALDAETGALVFAVPVPGTATGSAVLAVDALYVATTTNGVAAFDAQTGALRWQQPTGAGVVQPALLANGDLVSSTTSGGAFVLDRDGHTIRSMMLAGKPLAPPVIAADDTIYFGTDHGAAAYAADGTLRWQSTLVGQIVLGDNRLVVLPPTNTLAVIAP